MSDSPWQASVRRAVSSIPRGMTASYAQVALMAGKPGAARAVVRSLDAKMPWWRVVRSDGTVAPQMLEAQEPKLRREGVRLSGRRVPAEKRLTRA